MLLSKEQLFKQENKTFNFITYKSTVVCAIKDTKICNNNLQTMFFFSFITLPPLQKSDIQLPMAKYWFMEEQTHFIDSTLDIDTIVLLESSFKSKEDIGIVAGLFLAPVSFPLPPTLLYLPCPPLPLFLLTPKSSLYSLLPRPMPSLLPLSPSFPFQIFLFSLSPSPFSLPFPLSILLPTLFPSHPPYLFKCTPFLFKLPSRFSPSSPFFVKSLSPLSSPFPYLPS